MVISGNVLYSIKPLANVVGAYDGISMMFNVLANEILFADPPALFRYRDMNALNRKRKRYLFIFTVLNCLIPLIMHNFIHAIRKWQFYSN